ncbi:MAG: LysM peptidoglycan-binding protein [Paucimonas sp.]|nr:LysM peptidoglycan-binding protein [Paucimonas sp.]
MLAVAALSALLAACSTSKAPAPIFDRPAGSSRPTEAQRPRPPVPAAAAPQAPQTTPTVQRGFYTVKRGDTLSRIAQEFNQNWRDLVAWNNLASPNDIKVDQVLRVLPPEPGTAVPSPTPAPAATATAGTPGAVPVKNGPRGDKRPYSDATLAELSKAEGAPTVASIKPEAARPAERPVEKPAEQAASAEDVLDLVWPAEGRVVAGFDAARKGIDIAGKLGQPVVAAGSGSVLYAGSMRGYGNLVIVKHNANLLSAYAHNKTILVKEGQSVSRGQKIAEMGSSDTDSVKLHFEIRQQGKPVDPTKYLPNR